MCMQNTVLYKRKENKKKYFTVDIYIVHTYTTSTNDYTYTHTYIHMHAYATYRTLMISYINKCSNQGIIMFNICNYNTCKTLHNNIDIFFNYFFKSLFKNLF